MNPFWNKNPPSPGSGGFVGLDHGVSLGGFGCLDFVGAGVAVAVINGCLTVNIPGAGAPGMITAGAGLTGGGFPPTTLDVGANADGSIVVNPDDIQVSAAIQAGAAAGATALQVAGDGLTEAPAGQVNVGNADGSIVIGADEIHVSAAIQAGAAAGATAVQPARNLTAGSGLTGGGNLSADRTFNVGQNADNSVVVNADDIQVAAAIQSGAALGATSVQPARTLTAGAGLTGGGDLSANRTFDVGANADGSIVVNANDIQVSAAIQQGASTSTISQLPTSIQATIGDKSFRYVVPTGTSGAVSQVGTVVFPQSTASTPSPTNTDLRTCSLRVNTTTSVANTLVGLHCDPLMPFCRGAAAGVGGFFICFRFALVNLQADSIICVGLNNAVIAGGANPSATANRVAFAADTGDANVTVLSVDNAGAFTKTAIGGGLTKASLITGDPNTNGPKVLEASFWAPPNAAFIHAKLVDKSNAVTLFDGDVTLNLPLNTTNLRPTCVASSKGAVAAGTQHDLIYFYAYY